MPRAPRRLNLLDLVILIAAIAIGMGWMRFQATDNSRSFDPFKSPVWLQGSMDDNPLLGWSKKPWAWIERCAPCAATFTIGLLVVRLRSPRPRGGRVFLRPGAAACGAFALSLAWELLRLGLDLLRTLGRGWFEAKIGSNVGVSWWEPFYDVLRPEDHGIAVAAAWSALLLARRMRCERSTIDRLGRAVGIFWIVTLILSWAAGGILN